MAVCLVLLHTLLHKLSFFMKIDSTVHNEVWNQKCANQMHNVLFPATFCLSSKTLPVFKTWDHVWLMSHSDLPQESHSRILTQVSSSLKWLVSFIHFHIFRVHWQFRNCPCSILTFYSPSFLKKWEIQIQRKYLTIKILKLSPSFLNF